MLRKIVKSKIHGIRVTNKSLEYEGSITIDEEILKKADIIEGEMVIVINVNNGVRFETYVMKGKKKSGVCELNGGAARWGEIGDKLIIISTCLVESSQAITYIPKKIFVDDKNQLVNNCQ